jgi:hypothetical protein
MPNITLVNLYTHIQLITDHCSHEQNRYSLLKSCCIAVFARTNVVDCVIGRVIAMCLHWCRALTIVKNIKWQLNLIFALYAFITTTVHKRC